MIDKSKGIPYYQTIPELGIVGRINTPEEFDKIGLPHDLTGKHVLDIGCNMGAYLIESWKRGAEWVTGVEPDDFWRWLAIGIVSEIRPKVELFDIVPNFKEHKKLTADVVLLLSITHVVDGTTGQQILDEAYTRTAPGGLLIIEINDRLQKEKLQLPVEAKLYGSAKDNRSVYHVVKSNVGA